MIEVKWHENKEGWSDSFFTATATKLDLMATGNTREQALRNLRNMMKKVFKSE